jgi:hypothetical protein
MRLTDKYKETDKLVIRKKIKLMKREFMCDECKRDYPKQLVEFAFNKRFCSDYCIEQYYQKRSKK